MIAQMLAELRQLMRTPRRMLRSTRRARNCPSYSTETESIPLSIEELAKRWWYYTVELAPGLIAKGQYPDDLPMLPRIMLRRCQLAGSNCLDLGSMEGLIPTLMCRQGARRVTATDFNDHCREKMSAIQNIYRADFDFRPVGLLYELDKSLNDSSYDLINLSGLLYHVMSPLLVLAAVRPLLKRNGLLIVSTNVVVTDGYFMEFNNHGRLQVEANTFWYPSVQLFDYLLRFMKLAPIDCEMIPHQSITANSISTGGNYVFDKPSGYLSVVCRATDEVLPSADDTWMTRAAAGSWEHKHLIDWQRASRQPISQIGYACESRQGRRDQNCLDLFEAIQTQPPLTKVTNSRDSHILCLDDQV